MPFTFSSIYRWSFTYYKYQWNGVAAQVSNIKRIEDQKHELEVHVGAYPHQRSLRVSELGLIILVYYELNILDCKFLFDIVDCSSWYSSPQVFFTLKLVCFIGFSESSYLCLIYFSAA